jgi:hypothetical protein
MTPLFSADHEGRKWIRPKCAFKMQLLDRILVSPSIAMHTSLPCTNIAVSRR